MIGTRRSRTAPATPLVLTIAVAALSSAAILIRTAEAPAATVAFYRVASAALLMGGIALRGRATRSTPSQWAPVILAGTALGLHFWAWMRSLELISITTSTLLVTTTPLWIALASPLLPHEQVPDRKGWAGLAIALTGGALVASGDTLLSVIPLPFSANGHVPDPTSLPATAVPSVGPLEAPAHESPLLGVLLAVAGAWLMAVYLSLGRSIRQRMSLAPFAAATNGVAAVVLFACVLVDGSPLFGFDARTWAAIAGLVLLPQLIGHNALLWAVRTVGAAVVALVVLLEPVGASLLAWAVFGEPPTLIELGGGSLLLIGLAVVIGRRTQSADTLPRRAAPPSCFT